MNPNQPQINQFFGAGENRAGANLPPRNRQPQNILGDDEISKQQRNVDDDPDLQRDLIRLVDFSPPTSNNRTHQEHLQHLAVTINEAINSSAYSITNEILKADNWQHIGTDAKAWIIRRLEGRKDCNYRTFAEMIVQIDNKQLEGLARGTLPEMVMAPERGGRADEVWNAKREEKTA